MQTQNIVYTVDIYYNVVVDTDNKQIKINFYRAYIPMNRAQRFKNQNYVMNRDRQNSLSERGTAQDIGCNKKTSLEFYAEGSYSFRRFKKNREFSPDFGHSYRESPVIKLSLVLGTKGCKTDDLSCLGIFERCRRLDKQGEFKMPVVIPSRTSNHLACKASIHPQSSPLIGISISNGANQNYPIGTNSPCP